MKIGKYETHPAADLFPLLDGAEYKAFVEDIRTNGQLEKCVCVKEDGKLFLLDGRNRARAMYELGRTPQIRITEVADPYGFAWAHNITRKQYEVGQMAMLAIENEDGKGKWAQIRAEAQERMAEGGRSGSVAGPFEAREWLAKKAGCSPRTAQDAITVYESGYMHSDGENTLHRAVSLGMIALSQAVRLVRRTELAEKSEELPDGIYRVIYADPPWSYGTSHHLISPEGSDSRPHAYPTMTMDALKGMGVKEMAAENAVLFMWATVPLLPLQLEIVEAWGFEYKTLIVWDKIRPNVSTYTRANVELLVVATRGSCVPEISERADQVQRVERPGAHSAKPEHFRELIDKLYPSGPRIELFRRGDAPNGWGAWGNEAG